VTEAPGVRPSLSGGIRRRAARGTVINAAFLIGVNALGLLKGFIVAAFLAAGEYGLWGLLVISLGTLLWLAQFGINDKYVQQDHPDQERAFQIAFTLQAMLCGLFFLIILAAMPLFALAYGRWDIVPPAYVLALGMPAIALQTPLWSFYRDMEFGTQRKLQAFDPLVSFGVTIALVVAGMSYWGLVLGTLAGSWAAGLAAWRASPYRLRFRYERGTLREYATFSWPLMANSATGVLTAQVPYLVAQRTVGTAVVGGIALAASISMYAQRVDDVVTNTIYPAVCAVKDRADLLLEAFLKTNRLALLWAVPFGAGMALFAADLVHFAIGERWAFAIGLIQLFAIAAALNQVAFNWSAFFRALGTTRPIAVAGATMLAVVMLVAVPLLVAEGATGYAVGMLSSCAVVVVVRLAFLTRLFPLVAMLLNVCRAVLPTTAAALVVLAARSLERGDRTPGTAIAEVAAYLVLVGGFTLLVERSLLREFVAYLRRAPAPAPVT
jgi:O-antigen/teichoic acid export membrane protein